MIFIQISIDRIDDKTLEKGLSKNYILTEGKLCKKRYREIVGKIIGEYIANSVEELINDE